MEHLPTRYLFYIQKYELEIIHEIQREGKILGMIDAYLYFFEEEGDGGWTFAINHFESKPIMSWLLTITQGMDSCRNFKSNKTYILERDVRKISSTWHEASTLVEITVHIK